MNLNLAGLELSVEIRINLDSPLVADADVLGRMRSGVLTGTSPDLLQQRRRQLAVFRNIVPRRHALVECGANFTGDEGHDIAKGLVVVGIQIDAVNRRNQCFASNAEQTLFHVAQNLADQVVAVKTPRRTRTSHNRILCGILNNGSHITRTRLAKGLENATPFAHHELDKVEKQRDGEQPRPQPQTGLDVPPAVIEELLRRWIKPPA